MKKLLSTLLASTLILGSFSVMAQEPTVETLQITTLSSAESDFTISVSGEVKYIGAGGDVVVPPT